MKLSGAVDVVNENPSPAGSTESIGKEYDREVISVPVPVIGAPACSSNSACGPKTISPSLTKLAPVAIVKLIGASMRKCVLFVKINEVPLSKTI